jgi:NAD-dependent deacetylase
MAPKYIDFQNLLDSMQHPDSVIVISGTLGNVVPIEFLVQDLPCRKVLNNLEAYEHIDDSVFDLVFYEPATTAWPKIEEYIDDVMKTNFSNDA